MILWNLLCAFVNLKLHLNNFTTWQSNDCLLKRLFFVIVKCSEPTVIINLLL